MADNGERQQRLATALRANLKRRKQQERARAGEDAVAYEAEREPPQGTAAATGRDGDKEPERQP